VIGPHAVVMGDNVTLSCSVADPGLLSTFYLYSIHLSNCLFLYLYVNCNFLSDFGKFSYLWMHASLARRF